MIALKIIEYRKLPLSQSSLYLYEKWLNGHTD